MAGTQKKQIYRQTGMELWTRGNTNMNLSIPENFLTQVLDR